MLNVECSVCREFSAERINAVLNDPSVRPHVGLPNGGPLDFGPLVLDPRNYLLMADGGGFFLGAMGEGLYEVHSQFLPAARGKKALRAAQDGQRFMFCRTDAQEIVTFVPTGNLAATVLTRRMDMRPTFAVPDGQFYSLALEEWAALSEPADILGAIGARMPPARGVRLALALEMAAFGQVDKALRFFNRFAAITRGEPMWISGLNPTVLDFGDAKAIVGDENVEIC